MLGVALARVSTQLKSALRREAQHVAEPRPAGGGVRGGGGMPRPRSESVSYKTAVYGFA